MIDDLNLSIEALLMRELPDSLTQQITLSFATPDGQFPPASVSLPALDLFLYDLREDLEVRTSERMRATPTGTGTVNLQSNPVQVKCSYLVTAWSENAERGARDEHRLLSQVLKVFFRYPTLPDDILQGSLQGIQPRPRTLTLQPTLMNSPGEFWQAIGGKPKPAVHYSVTIPVDVFAPIEDVPLIQTTTTTVTVGS